MEETGALAGFAGGGVEDPRFYEALGRAIKVVRAQRGVGRRDLARLAEVSYPYLSEIENGKKRPSSRALLSIADALSLPASRLLAVAEGIVLEIQDERSPSAPTPASPRHRANPAASPPRPGIAVPEPEPDEVAAERGGPPPPSRVARSEEVPDLRVSTRRSGPTSTASMRPSPAMLRVSSRSHLAAAHSS